MRLIGGSDQILVPKLLLDNARSCGFRRERIETVLLIWWLVDGWPVTDGTPDRWKCIHDRNFEGVTKNTSSRSKARKWLIENRFMKMKEVKCKDGIERPERIKGYKSQSYATNPLSDIVSYRLARKDSLATCITVYTANDDASQQTRRVLGLLKKKQYKNIENRQSVLQFRENRNCYSVLAIEHNLGTVKRGRVVNRLYSPWTGARKLIRSLFTIEDREIWSLDLRAAQPMLMAILANDRNMSEACFDDSFYGDLSSELELPRKQAKNQFYCYSFGHNRTKPSIKNRAYEVQEWMKKKFPAAAKYVFSKKIVNYRAFAREMQNREAALFVDGIFSELTKYDLPALTVHDAIYYKDTDHQQVKTIAEQHLKKHFKRTKFALNEER